MLKILLVIGEVEMIQLTRFTGEEFYLNPDVIKSVEQSGDTVIFLMNGERVLVTESPEDVCKKFMDYKQKITSGPLTTTV